MEGQQSALGMDMDVPKDEEINITDEETNENCNVNANIAHCVENLSTHQHDEFAQSNLDSNSHYSVNITNDQQMILKEVLPTSMNNTDINTIVQSSSNVEELCDAGLVGDDQSTTKQSSVRSSRLPMSRIKSIMKMDPEVRLASQEAVVAITKAAVSQSYHWKTLYVLPFANIFCLFYILIIIIIIMVIFKCYFSGELIALT